MENELVSSIWEYPWTRNLPYPPLNRIGLCSGGDLFQCPPYVLKKVAWFFKFENLRNERQLKRKQTKKNIWQQTDLKKKKIVDISCSLFSNNIKPIYYFQNVIRASGLRRFEGLWTKTDWNNIFCTPVRNKVQI